MKKFSLLSNVCTALEYRTILIWSTQQFEDSNNRKFFRVNINYDYGIKLSWSPDSKAIAIYKYIDNCIEVYKLDKKDGWFQTSSRAITFPKTTDDDIMGFGIACTGRFIMLCNNKTDLFVLDLKGNILEKLDTYLMANYSGKISPCGRYIGVCGFAPDCKIWEVKFSRNGEYQKTIRAFDLCGHTSGIYDLAFDGDSSHIATISKDGTFKLYDIKIEHEKGQTPRLLKTGKYTQKGLAPNIALSLNAEVLAVATGNQIEIYSMHLVECDIVIKRIYNGFINKIIFDPLGKFLLVCGDKQIRIYHNLTGYKTSIQLAEQKLKKGGFTNAMKERLENQIDDCNKFLKKFI